MIKIEDIITNTRLDLNKLTKVLNDLSKKELKENALEIPDWFDNYNQWKTYVNRRDVSHFLIDVIMPFESYIYHKLRWIADKLNEGKVFNDNDTCWIILNNKYITKMFYERVSINEIAFINSKEAQKALDLIKNDLG